MNQNLVLCIMVPGILCMACRHAGENESKPNIVLIISDDQGWTDYSFIGHKYIETPNIDRLAFEGLTFTRGYVTAPLCRPSLASMATGLYPHQHNVIGNDPVFDFDQKKKWQQEWMEQRAVVNKSIIDAFENLPTLPDLLKEKGYLSFQSGKWWEGYYSRGGFTHGMTHGNPENGGRHGDIGLEIGRQGLDTLYRFINMAQQEDKPFFVWYAPFMPHAPHTPPDSLKEKYLSIAPTPAVANYWAMCEWFDITCGRLMDFIEQKELSENTLFVYVCDNGWIQDPERPNNFAARSKTSPYEMGIRTPIMFRWKGIIEPKMDTATLISSIDIAATILDICDISPTGKMQGINVLDTDKLAEREAVFSETYAHDFTSVDSSLYCRIILTQPWKLILPDEVNRKNALPELYNIMEDPHEQINQAEAQPGIVAGLTDQIDRWWNED